MIQLTNIALIFQMQFFGPVEFCRYNMFNHYFFDNEESHRVGYSLLITFEKVLLHLLLFIKARRKYM